MQPFAQVLRHGSDPLAEIARSGALPVQLSDMFAHVLLASINEIALVIAEADDTEAAMRDGAAAVDELFERLLRPPVQPRSARTRERGRRE
jgi:hypothetical protein